MNFKIVNLTTTILCKLLSVYDVNATYPHEGSFRNNLSVCVTPKMRQLDNKITIYFASILIVHLGDMPIAR